MNRIFRVFLAVALLVASAPAVAQSPPINQYGTGNWSPQCIVNPVSYTVAAGTFWLPACTSSGALNVTPSSGGSIASPGYTRIQDGTGTLLANVAGWGSQDAVATTFEGLINGTYSLGYNGSTWDRLRTTQAFSGAYPTGLFAVGPTLAGTGSAVYVASVADATAAVNITTATTTQVVAGTTGQNIFLHYAACQTAGTNSAATCLWEAGTGATCGTGTLLLFGTAAQPLGTASGAWTTAYAGNTLAAAAGSIVPAASPYVIPAGDSLCVTTAGTTINLYAYAETAKH